MNAAVYEWREVSRILLLLLLGSLKQRIKSCIYHLHCDYAYIDNVLSSANIHTTSSMPAFGLVCPSARVFSFVDVALVIFFCCCLRTEQQLNENSMDFCTKLSIHLL